MAFNIQTGLSNLNERYSEITELIPDIFYFYDDGRNQDQNLNLISDGGYDMYDGANQYYTNLKPNQGGGEASDVIAYTHTQSEDTLYNGENNTFTPYTTPPMDGVVADGNDYFGPGSTYFTNMYPGLFVLVADGCDITYFEINGDIGSDADETVSVSDFTITQGSTTYSVFLKASGETPDPSINHIIIVPNGSDIEHTYSNGNGSDLDKVTNESGLGSRVYSLVVARRTDPGGGEGDQNGPRLSQEDAEAIASKFIEILEGVVFTTGFTISPVVTFEVIGYHLQDIIGNGPLPDTLENMLNALNARTVWIETVGAYKHGDQFTVFGTQANYLNKLYVNVDSPTLKVISWE